MGGIIAPNVSVILPPPTAINIIEFSLLVWIQWLVRLNLVL